MTKQEILENNQLIAEFMEFNPCKVYNYKGKQYDYYLPNGFELIKEVETTIESNWCEILEEQDNCFIEDLKFHKSWDWLIPVIQKLLTLKLKEIVPSDLDISYVRNKHYLSVNNLLDINVLFKNVVEFIEWYNKKHK